MNKNLLLTVSSIIMLALGGLMVYLGASKNLLPPTITGIGFLVIAFVFLGLRSR